MDDIQIIEEAREVLRQIMEAYPNDEVGLLAGSMGLAVRPDIYNMQTRNFPADRQADALKRARSLEEVPTKFAEAAAKAAAKRSPAYATPVFKCLGDFEKCKAARTSSKYVCRALLAICVGKHLIPFVPKGHDGQ